MSKTCVVTGVTGYVGSWVAKLMVEKGYTVRGTVRSTTSTRSLQLADVFMNMSAEGQLVLFQADLLEEDSLTDTLFGGAEYIFHVASPCFLQSSDPETELLRPARQGTINVLTAAARNKSNLKRVIVTSSMAAVKDLKGLQPKAGRSGMYSEVDWNTISTADEEPYLLSKVQGERAAWAAAKDFGLDVVTVLPNFVLGPVVSKGVAGSGSVAYCKALLEAPDGCSPHFSYLLCDVRDVAKAHVLAAETASASGRYIISNPRRLDGHDVTEILKKAFPKLDIAGGIAAPAENDVDGSRVVVELGLVYTPVETTMVDMATSLIDTGIAIPRSKAFTQDPTPACQVTSAGTTPSA